MEKNLKKNIYIHTYICVYVYMYVNIYNHFAVHLECCKSTVPQLKEKKKNEGVPTVVQWKRIRLVSMRMQVRSLASLSGLRIQHCCELWCRPAAAALIQPLAWLTSISCGCIPKKITFNLKKIFKGEKPVFPAPALGWLLDQ